MTTASKCNAVEDIQSEHRAILAVVHCLEQIVKEIRAGTLAPPFDVLRLIVRYLLDFPDRFHHPKEEEHLFPPLAKRASDVGDAIQELTQQHHDGRRLTADLKWKLEAYAEDPEIGFAAFEKRATEYIEFQRRHVQLEEQKILPAACEHLTDADWAAIGRAFEDNEDPIFGLRPQLELDKLFTRIVVHAPQPWGLKPRDQQPRREILKQFPPRTT